MTEETSLRVLFLTLYPETMPSSRLRVYQYLPYLKQAGIEAVVRPSLPEPWFSRFYFSKVPGIHWIQFAAEAVGSVWRLREARRYDVIFVQKGILSTSLKGFDRLVGNPKGALLFDLDDLVYGRCLTEFSVPWLRALQDPGQTVKISARSFAVIAGNSYLRDLAFRYNSNAHLIPTPVDTNRFVPRERNEKGPRPVVIGWMGVEATLGYLRSLEAVFRALARRYAIQLKIVSRKSQRNFSLNGVPVKFETWSYENEVNELADFDIGIAPLGSDEWARAKCGLKLLQCMAMGLPTVSTRFGTHCDIVEDGVDGFLAGTAEEWEEKLSVLIENADRRKQMGEAARKKVLAQYSLEKTAPQLIELLKCAAGRRTPSCETLKA